MPSLSASLLTVRRAIFRPLTAWMPVPIRVLNASHRALLLQHLMALGGQDRYLRFGYAATDNHIERYVEGLDFEHDRITGVFDADLQLIAMAHLALGAGAEFGVSVLPQARGGGLGSLLFRRACMDARNAGVSSLLIYALRENTAMLEIARNAGAQVELQGAETEAQLSLPSSDLVSQIAGMGARFWGHGDYHWKKQMHGGRKVLGVVQEVRNGVRAARSQTAR